MNIDLATRREVFKAAGIDPVVAEGMETAEKKNRFVEIEKRRQRIMAGARDRRPAS